MIKSWTITNQEFRKFQRKKPVLESIFNKVSGLQVCNFIKKRLQTPVKFAKFLRAPFFTEPFRRLSLNFVSGIQEHWWFGKILLQFPTFGMLEKLPSVLVYHYYNFLKWTYAIKKDFLFFCLASHSNNNIGLSGKVVNTGSLFVQQRWIVEYGIFMWVCILLMCNFMP